MQVDVVNILFFVIKPIENTTSPNSDIKELWHQLTVVGLLS
jgi:hypothetical protein